MLLFRLRQDCCLQYLDKGINTHIPIYIRVRSIFRSCGKDSVYSKNHSASILKWPIDAYWSIWPLDNLRSQPKFTHIRVMGQWFFDPSFVAVRQCDDVILAKCSLQNDPNWPLDDLRPQPKCTHIWVLGQWFFDPSFVAIPPCTWKKFKKCVPIVDILTHTHPDTHTDRHTHDTWCQ